MKNLVLNKPFVFSLTLFAFAFTGCNLFDNANDVTFTTTLDQTFNVDEEDIAENKAYSQEIVVDATADPQIDKYKNKIKRFTVTKVTYKITSYASAVPVTFSNGSISFSSSDATSAEAVTTISSIDLQDAYYNGTEYELTLSTDAITKIQNYLKANRAVKVYLAGTLSQTPVSFDVEVSLDLKVESGVL